MIDVYGYLKAAGLKIRKDHYPQPVLPFGVYLDSFSTIGDDRRPDRIEDHSIQILWAAAAVDSVNETLIENVLVGLGLNYSKTRDWLDTEKMYQTTYDVSIYSKK